MFNRLFLNNTKQFLYLYQQTNFMLIINVDGRGIEKALKELKSKVIKTKQNKKLFERKEFVKESVKRRKEIQKAAHIQKLKSSN
jgi:small subunit ribosomal protein S21